MTTELDEPPTRAPMPDVASWRPPPGFVQVESKVAGVVVHAPAPAPKDAPLPETFTCERCGNASRHDAGSHELVCEHCSSRSAITQVSVSAPAAAEFRVSTLEVAKRGWGAERSEVHCETCGADVVVGPGVLTAQCSFCESERVVNQPAAQEVLRPSGILPFVVTEDAAATLIKGWLSRGRFVPASLSSASSTLRVHGVYLPHFIFDARVFVNWRCEVGKRVKRGDGYVTVWEPRFGQTKFTRSAEPVVGVTDGVNLPLLNEIEPFRLSELTDYRTEYLAGWQARSANKNLEAAWAEVRKRWREAGSVLARGEIGSGQIRNYTADVRYDNERWRYVLLPVHLASYEFEGTRRPVLVNGQTAELAGQRPLDVRLFAKFAAAVIAPGVLASVVARVLVDEFNLPPLLVPAAFVLLLAGIGYAGLTYVKETKVQAE